MLGTFHSRIANVRIYLNALARLLGVVNCCMVLAAVTFFLSVDGAFKICVFFLFETYFFSI